MMFHCGPPFCAGWAVDDEEDVVAAKSGRRSISGVLKPNKIQDELTEQLDKAIDQIGVKMRWEVGDFAINDNLGNCHYAAPGTQNPKRKAGLRILHRTTIAGETVPTKHDGRQSFM